MAHKMSPLDLLADLQGKTAVITGAARGIGAATAALFNAHGCNVVISDLPSLQPQAELLMQSLKHRENILFIAASVVEWKEMVHVFKEGLRRFGKIDIVVANAGIMESRAVLEVEIDNNGDPVETKEGHNIIDVNLKGTLNTITMALHYMRGNELTDGGFRGSVVLVTSTSGYFGLTGNVAYVASKHGIVGLLRASQRYAKSHQIRVNAIAPSFTPTQITAGFGDKFQNAGVESNTPETVAEAIAYAALNTDRFGTCHLVAGSISREMEHTQQAVMPQWLGKDLLNMLAGFSSIINEMGGYPLPPVAAKR